MRSDVLTTSSVFEANRARGVVRFDVHARDGVTRRGILHESGSLRVRFPSPEGEGLSGVFVNTAGGVAGGDNFDIDIAAGEGSRLTLTTAAAEKVYRAPGAAAQLNIGLKVAAGAHIGWLPQETILFDRARVHRSFDIALDVTASLLLCEIVVFGRTAMGERVEQGEFVDRWRLSRGGKLVFAETVRLDGNIGAKLARSAMAQKRRGDRHGADRARRRGIDRAHPGSVGLILRRGRNVRLEWLCNGAVLCPRCGAPACRHDDRAGAQRCGAAEALAELTG
ncbi:urease accessory protein [Bradyrhizobium sp. LM6.10]